MLGGRRRRRVKSKRGALKRLKSKLDLKVYEHIASENTYEAALLKLGQLFIKAKNLNSAQNKLITALRREGETVQAFLLRLQVGQGPVMNQME